MSDLIQGWGLVMFSHYGLIKVLRVKVYMEGTIRLLGISQWWHPGGRFWNWSYNSFQDHLIQWFFYLFPIFYRDFPPGMLHWAKGRVSPDGVGPWDVTYSVKRVRKGSFQCYNVPDLSCGMRGSHQGWLYLFAVENRLWDHLPEWSA